MHIYMCIYIYIPVDRARAIFPCPSAQFTSNGGIPRTDHTHTPPRLEEPWRPCCRRLVFLSFLWFAVWCQVLENAEATESKLRWSPVCVCEWIFFAVKFFFALLSDLQCVAKCERLQWYIFTYMNIFIYVCLYMYVYVSCEHLCVATPLCCLLRCQQIHANIYVHTYIYMYIYTYIYTYIHNYWCVCISTYWRAPTAAHCHAVLLLAAVSGRSVWRSCV